MTSPLPAASFASVLGTALNALLSHQPAARTHLRRHAGKRLVLALPLGPEELSLDEEGRFTVPGPDTEADELAGAVSSVTLTPRFAALPQWLSGGTVSDLFSVQGDGLLAADLAQALADFDWVLALRPYVGDMAASRVDRLLQGFRQWRGEAMDAAGRNLAEYAVHEAGLLADAEAVRDFIHQVDRLREDADRLEARLKLLEQREA
jgi:ubiquinone biosynthesis protein UbiJ